jgi:hypothetical protein
LSKLQGQLTQQTAPKEFVENACLWSFVVKFFNWLSGAQHVVQINSVKRENSLLHIREFEILHMQKAEAVCANQRGQSNYLILLYA